MAVSGILSFSSPRGDAQVIFGISNPANLVLNLVSKI